MKAVNLTNHFLIAMPAMQDPYFARSLTYICEHSEEGALGIIVNRPTDMTLGSLFEQIEIPLADDSVSGQPVYFGGPVQMDRGFVLHSPVGKWTSTMAMNEDLGLTTSKDILEAVSNGSGPGRFMLTLGYAGWGAGQLEEELAQNAWLTVPASTDVIFDLPVTERFEAAMGLLGINLMTLSDQAGHA